MKGKIKTVKVPTVIMKQLHKLYHTIEKDLDEVRDIRAKSLLNKVRLGLKFLLVRSKYNPYKNKRSKK